MKIGILASGNDMLTLFSFLNRHDHEYVVWYDDAYFSWGDKSLDLVMERVNEGVKFILEKGVDSILVPPIIELSMYNQKHMQTIILPLFVSYLQKYCFMYSLVGKIGYVGDWLDIQEGQQQLEILAKHYVLTEHQRSIKKFHFPFVRRKKETRIWKYLLENLSWSNLLVNTLVKNDLRYFKDAGTDTVIPFNYSYFHVQKTIKGFFNFKKTRFHDMQKLEDIFVGSNLKPSKEYSVDVYCTGHGEFLTKEKRLMRLLGRGKGLVTIHNYL